MKLIFRVFAVFGIILSFFSCPALHGPALADEVEDGVAYYRQGEYRTAFGVLKRFAERGDPDAQFLLAGMYLHGKGIHKNEKLAGKWMQTAAEAGHRGAQRAMARFYREGIGGVEKDLIMADLWDEKAAQAPRSRCEGTPVGCRFDN
ncbi:MAG: sel1 repeat family protein [Burkholderiaceae bacterium]|jgi:TPR repeat protein|nr:sel1 repeat family protein [Burkholderiaceae bacterium]